MSSDTCVMYSSHRRAWVDQQATFLLFQFHSKHSTIYCEITFAHSLCTNFSKTRCSFFFQYIPMQIEIKMTKLSKTFLFKCYIYKIPLRELQCSFAYLKFRLDQHQKNLLFSLKSFTHGLLQMLWNHIEELLLVLLGALTSRVRLWSATTPIFLKKWRDYNFYCWSAASYQLLAMSL